jgi:hypothetical protein
MSRFSLGGWTAASLSHDIFLFAFCRRRYTKEWHKIQLYQIKLEKFSFRVSPNHISTNGTLAMFWQVQTIAFFDREIKWSLTKRCALYLATFSLKSLVDVYDLTVLIHVESF